MNIAFLLAPGCVVQGKSNGIRMQALIWKEGLEQLGHQVTLVNSWGNYSWADFDFIHLFGNGEWLKIVEPLSQFNTNIGFSPIIDSNENLFAYKIASYMGVDKLRIYTSNNIFRRYSRFIKLFFVRSQHEANYLLKSYDIPSERICLVPLSYRTEVKSIDYSKKEDFCLHVSTFTQERKNVRRLIQAAIKYNFSLVIAGSKGTSESYKPFAELIDGHPNIKVLGFLSNEELENYYLRAKVFALPSVMEGVGLVALEAAMHGCEIVITREGGPKEYFEKHAFIINPYSIDDIGISVMNALKGTGQSDLYEAIKTKYNLESCMKQLVKSYSLKSSF